jgi:glycosyltransferase involved in cell wall biosynthesis
MRRVVLIRSNPVRPYPRLEKMANCLVEMGYGVTVLAWDRDDNYEAREEVLELKSTHVKIVRVGIKGQFSGGFKKNFNGLIKFQCFIFKWLSKYRKEYDVIHAYDFDTGFIALRCARLYKKKFVYDIPDYYIDSHGLNGSRLGNIIKRMENKVINRADATIICTEERKEQIKDANPRRLVVIHNTPDFFIKSQDGEVQGDKLKLVYVGVFGTTRFIDKIVEVVSKRSDCEFHIGGFGGGMEEFFKSAAEKFDNIFYYGRILYARTIELEQECDVMCAIYDPKVPNHYFAAPNKFYEALMLGKPLIMAKNTGMASIVEANQLGEVIEYNEKSLNDAISRLIKTREDFSSLSNRAQLLYRECYSWISMEKKIDELYRNI